MTATAIFPETDPVSITITAHRQPCWTPGWITTNRIVFPRVGNPRPTERLDAARREAILLEHLKDLGLQPYQIEILSTPRRHSESGTIGAWLERIIARITARKRPVAFFRKSVIRLAPENAISQANPNDGQDLQPSSAPSTGSFPRDMTQAERHRQQQLQYYLIARSILQPLRGSSPDSSAPAAAASPVSPCVPCPCPICGRTHPTPQP